MSVMSGADALVTILDREGVDTVFGIPGVQIMAAVDAIYRNGNIRWISTRHEQTAAYMAYGYARSTGRTGVAMVLPGPGALNTTAAIGTAYSASTPVLLISGQIESYYLGLNKGVLHQLDEQMDIFVRLTKWSGRATKPQEIPAILQQALRHLKSGRARPVEIEVPYDFWQEEADMSLQPVTPNPVKPPNPAEIRRATDLLSNARRPVILAGGGAVTAGTAGNIVELAERLGAPVVMTTEGQGIIPIDHPLCACNFTLWTNPALAQADVVLAVGSRLRASGDTRLSLRPDQKLVQIDIDAGEIGRNHDVELGIAADAGVALKEILSLLPGHGTGEWQPGEIAELRAAIGERIEKAAPVQLSIIRSISGALPDDSIIVPDITNIGYWCDIAYPVTRPRTYIDSSYFATLGFAFPTALGAKVGNPDSVVVALCGDGGFPYAATELATAVQENIDVITVVFTDNAYGTVTGIQQRQFGGRYIGNTLHNPDYVKLAESFGASGIRCSHYDETGDALKSAIAAGRPVVIEVPVPPLDAPWYSLTAGG